MARGKTKGTGHPVLRFFEAAKFSGFRSSGLSPYNNADPHTVVRELVQNSLDAAIDAGRDVVRVVFELSKETTTDIPARSQFLEHLESAIDTQRRKNNLEQSRAIVDAMRASICAEEVPVLWVSDNGIGLDAKGMEDLLGDALSGKADPSTAGSFGNGHMTSFPASDLRYIVYGGTHAGGRTVSGHAILASHAFKKKLYGEDGYLARKVRQHDLFSRFDFCDGSNMPLLKEKLDWVEKEFGTGSVVGILGFNGFNRFDADEEVLEVIETVVSTHFTPLVRSGNMKVALRSAEASARMIDGARLEAILERRRYRERRDRNSIGPSGRQAWETLETLKPEYGHTIETKSGKVRLHLRILPRAGGGRTHLQLFRNGMWITNDVPHNRPSDYRNTVPFNGVILLEPREADKACELVGKFEGPRHIDVDLTRQQRGSIARKALERFLTEVHEGVLELVPRIEAEEFDPDFFSIEVAGEGVRKNPRASAPGVGTPEPAPRRQPQRTREKTRRKRKRRKQLRRDGRRVDARVTAVRRTRGIRLRARPLESAANVELRVVLANGSDETCDSPEPDVYLEIGEVATISGQAVKDYVVDKNGTNRAVLLGPVSAGGDELDIWLPCRPAATGDVRVELVRRSVEPGEA